MKKCHQTDKPSIGPWQSPQLYESEELFRFFNASPKQFLRNFITYTVDFVLPP